jgi:hypothetical protein
MITYSLDTGTVTKALRQQVARTAAFAVRVFSASSWADQIRARGPEGILTRSTIKPQRLSCSSALMPAYSL